MLSVMTTPRGTTLALDQSAFVTLMTAVPADAPTEDASESSSCFVKSCTLVLSQETVFVPQIVTLFVNRPKESYAAMANASSPSSIALPAASVARLGTALVLIM